MTSTFRKIPFGAFTESGLSQPRRRPWKQVRKLLSQSKFIPESKMFKYIVEGWLMPSVSLFGLAGNFLSMYILHHREVKLKKEFVDVLCMLATFDNLLLIATFFLFSLPTLSSTYLNAVSSFKLNFNTFQKRKTTKFSKHP